MAGTRTKPEPQAPPEPEADDNGARGTSGTDERTIHERMIAVLAALPAIGKDQRNEQQKFMYRGHDDVMNALNPLLAEHGIFAVPTVRERVATERQTSRGSTMYEINLLVHYRFYGMKGDYVEASSWGEGTDMGDKSTNKAMTMAFKNVLAQAFAISTAELSDADGASPEETKRRQGGEAQPRRDRDKPFDPGRDLMPKAIRGEKTTARLHEAMQGIDPGLDWGSIVSEAAMAKFGRPRAELDTDETTEFWRRLSNTVCWIIEEAGSGDFPPIEQAVIAAGFVFGFGAELALPLPLAVPDEPDGATEALAGLSDHDAAIPFGEDEPKEDG